MQITVNYTVIIHASLHHGVAAPRAARRHHAPPRTSGLRVTEAVRQWGNVGPTGTEGDGLLVSRAWRSRALGMELVQNKVVPPWALARLCPPASGCHCGDPGARRQPASSPPLRHAPAASC